MESKEALRTAKLPEFLEAQTVDQMLPGETKAAQTEILLVEPNRNVWLHPEWKVYDNPSEKHPLLITRTEEGYVVDTTLVEESGWFSNTAIDEIEVDGKKPLPILQIIFNLNR